MEDILIDWVLVTGIATVLAFVINQAAAWGGLEVSIPVKKGVAFAVSLGLAAYFAFQGNLGLPDPAVDPMAFAVALLASATLVFKAAQQVYDRVWSGLISA
jgi:hypothetical protein